MMTQIGHTANGGPFLLSQSDGHSFPTHLSLTPPPGFRAVATSSSSPRAHQGMF